MPGDRFVSRRHCVVVPDVGGLSVTAYEALNAITVRGREFRTAVLQDGDVFFVGQTAVRIRRGDALESAVTERLVRSADHALRLRHSTRELVDYEGTLIAQFSPAEFAAFQALARRYPDAVSHHELGRAVWGETGFDQYQLHRLLQRIRQRLGDAAMLLDNVRGSGYRLRAAVSIE